jgi:hypothetical protein
MRILIVLTEVTFRECATCYTTEGKNAKLEQEARLGDTTHQSSLLFAVNRSVPGAY